MSQSYDYIYLSPHLDDAILSCGAQIFQHRMAGLSVLVITVLAGDPTELPISGYAELLHRRWQIEFDNVAARRDEDAAACQRLGAEYQHWPVPDCIYRRNSQSGQPLYLSDEAIFAGIDPDESNLIISVSEMFNNMAPYERMILPLAIGNLVDHQLVRLAAEQSVDREKLFYYEDFPYVSMDVELKLAALMDQHWTNEIFEVTPLAVKAKIEAIACYDSQFSTFFGSIEDMEKQVSNYIIHLGGERIWRTASSSKALCKSN